MRRFNLSLAAKINLIILFAVLVPTLVLGTLSVSSLRTLALDNLESFVQETGSRREAAIESDLRTALNNMNEFISANEPVLLLALEQQESGLQDASFEDLRDNVQSRIREQLIETRLYNSVRLLSEVYFPYTTVVRQDQTAPGTLQQQRQAVSLIAERINLNSGDIQVFGVTDRGNNQRVEVLTALLATDEDGNRVLEGYLLVDLNLDEIFINNLERDEGEFDTNAYVIVARNENRIVLAPDDVRDANLFDISSFGAERALSNLASAVDIYEVESNGETREVMGYSASLVIDDEAFALIAEVETAQVFTNLTQQAVAQIFVGTIALTVVVIIFSLLTANQLIIPPLRNLRTAILAIIRGEFDTPVSALDRKDEIGSLATSFVDMRQYVREVTEDMNRRLQERNRDVQITQEIARAVTAERDLTTLMNRVVNLIIQNFPSIYHAQIFLLDADQKNAILRASTGAAGRELLARGHKLRVGSVSVIGQVTEQAQVIIARDTAESNVHRQNEFLSETRAELAIPLQFGEATIGVLDVQSKQRDSFDNNQVAALQTLADQITIAIENTRLYAESERLVQEADANQAAATRRAWQQFQYQLRQGDMAIRSGAPTSYNYRRLTQAVIRSGEPVVGEPTNRDTVPFVVPIKLRNQTLGVVEYEVPQAEFNYDKVLLAQELVSRLAIGLENARLFQASQEATERERIVNDITAKLTNHTNIEDILQTAVREIEQALRTPQVAIRLNTTANGNGTNGNSANGSQHHPNGNHADDPSQ